MHLSLETKDIITFGTALYGAVLSTLAFRQSRRKEEKQVTLQCTVAVRFDEDDNPIAKMTVIEVINSGQRPVVVSDPTFRMPNGKLMFFLPAEGRKQFPKSLADGEKVSLYCHDDALGKALRAEGYSGKVRLIPQCTDQTEKQYWGEKLIFDATDPDLKPTKNPWYLRGCH
jgi:hypothetical protein